MIYELEIPGFESEKFEYQTGLFKSIFRRGTIPCVRAPGKKKIYRVVDDQGCEKEVELKGQFFDPVPTVYADGKSYRFTEPLSKLQLAWAALPFLPLFGGGAIGGALAGGGFVVSLSFFRSKLPLPLRYLSVWAFAGLSWGIYLFLAGLIKGATSNL